MHPLRRYLAVLNGIVFSLTLLYLTFRAPELNNDFWQMLVLPSKAAELGVPVGRMLLESLGIVVVMAILMQLVRRLDPKFDPKGLLAANMNFRLLLHPWLRYPFALLLVYNLPILATAEEFIFRHGLSKYPISNWQDVVVRSLLFGLAHALVSWNLRGGIIQTALGFWFSYQYQSGMPDRLMHASAAHFFVDLIALAPALLQLCMHPPSRRGPEDHT